MWAFPQPNKPDKAVITGGHHVAFSSLSFLYPLNCCPKKRNLWKGEQSYDLDIYTPYISEPLLDFIKVKWWICSNNSIYIFEASFAELQELMADLCIVWKDPLLGQIPDSIKVPWTLIKSDKITLSCLTWFVWLWECSHGHACKKSWVSQNYANSCNWYSPKRSLLMFQQ